MTTRFEIQMVQATLKRLVFSAGHHYEDMAAYLGVSLSTAKRILNGEDLSFERVLSLCDWLDLSFAELMEMVQKPEIEYHYASLEQEDFLASHVQHFAYLVQLQANKTPDEIAKAHRLSTSDSESYLADLESHKFLVRKPNGLIKLLVPDGMDWRPNGPLRKSLMGKMIQGLLDHYLRNDETREQCFIDFGHKILTAETYAAMRQELDELSRKYGALSRLEPRVYGPSKVSTYTYVLLADRWKSPLWELSSSNSDSAE